MGEVSVIQIADSPCHVAHGVHHKAVVDNLFFHRKEGEEVHEAFKDTYWLRSIREYRSNVLRSYRSLERLVVPKLIAAREIGKANGLVVPTPYLIADTFEERHTLFQVDATHLCKVLLKMWWQSV